MERREERYLILLYATSPKEKYINKKGKEKRRVLQGQWKIITEDFNKRYPEKRYTEVFLRKTFYHLDKNYRKDVIERIMEKETKVIQVSEWKDNG
jgi:hypothetical protein